MADISTRVVRNDIIRLDEISGERPDFIVLGPGPGHPSEARYLEIIERFGGDIPTSECASDIRE